ncbi:MAG: substrate-binding domain-containing protein [Solirubrobacteraceae bacterium]
MRLTRHNLPVVGLLLSAALILPGAALADNASTLTVVGTSDVSDSGLVQNLIQPGFTAAYPQFTFKYVGSATGVAIQSAEAGGANGPSVLIVHAASLENQFVGNSFSYNQYGNAIFRNDFVLAGPSGDPAGVGANAANNIAQAFADIATAGVNGKATFVSRGGTNTAPGTTVEEHALWGQMNTAGLTPTGVVLCNVSTVDGGGMTPIKPSVQATSGQACPDSGTVSSTDAPSWYVVNTGANQAKNVEVADGCSGIGSGAGTCYVLSDRGTFDYLANGASASGGASLVPDLKIVTRDNSASAPGGAFALINYFHAYVINPGAPNEAVNLTAAQDFVAYLTSATFQAQLKTYLANTGDSAGAPFVADASPTVTATGFPTTVTAGRHVTVTGAVTNNEIGYPALANQTVTLDQLVGGVLVPVPGATATTGTDGSYSLTFTPSTTATYQVSTGTISMIENPSLTPPYGDLLTPGASAAATVTVNGAVTIGHVSSTKGGAATITGSVAPAAPDANGVVTLLSRRLGSTAAFTPVTLTELLAGQGTYSIKVSLKPGKYQLEATYEDGSAFTLATSQVTSATIGSTTKPKPKHRHHKKKNHKMKPHAGRR